MFGALTPDAVLEQIAKTDGELAELERTIARTEMELLHARRHRDNMIAELHELDPNDVRAEDVREMLTSARTMVDVLERLLVLHRQRRARLKGPLS